MECVVCSKEIIGKQKKFSCLDCKLKQWRKNNPDYIKRYGYVNRNRKWRIENPELHLKQIKKYKENHPEIVKKYKRKDQIKK